jgi:G protein beta subunit-like protein
VDEVYEHLVDLAGHGGWVWDCEFTSDSVYCITVSTDTKILIWKIEKADVRKTLTGHTKGITCLAFCEGQAKGGAGVSIAPK